MLSPREIEEMIRDTDGVPVVVGVVSTWGHLRNVGGAEAEFGAMGGTTADGGTAPDARVVSIAAGLGAAPVEGGSIMVDSAEEQVRAIRGTASGNVIRMLLADRTHRVAIFRRIWTGEEDDYGNAINAWTLVADNVGADLEPRSGAIDQDEVGRTVEEKWRGMLPPSTDLRADDGILVRSGPGPSRYLVSYVAPHGARWDLRADLERTTEEFG